MRVDWGTYPADEQDREHGACHEIAVAFYDTDRQRGPVIRDYGIRGFWIWQERREEFW